MPLVTATPFGTFRVQRVGARWQWIYSSRTLKETPVMISVPTLTIILVIVLIIFGAGKLPEIGSSLGKGIKDFKKAVEDDPPEKQEEKIEKIESRPAAEDPSKTPSG
jgi:sec-independent protein translocase protein TatA